MKPATFGTIITIYNSVELIFTSNPMKKLPMIIGIVVSIFSAQGVFAQDELAENDAFEIRDYEYEQHEYTEIENVELPTTIQYVAARDFENLRIYRAYISKDNTYKIVLKDKDNYTKVVFASANGKWIKPDDKS
ncbi:hypothetical protein [Aquimarina sp. 2201CG5-10]|uniref:hypothetical protein n=1 Tax=Aquimarina callyspongiae TaxID=3098150 RepID=UPI002AB45BA4|nr:hypothetical protein [Aquimarina sp. 2201CG5-10]MDY8135034.1 hypothetical protein [Aquimarina sp. 2201CG5-10]